MAMGIMLRCRARYLTDGAVIGSRAFVEEVFEESRERFGPNRKDGARKGRGRDGSAVEFEGLEEGGLKVSFSYSQRSQRSDRR